MIVIRRSPMRLIRMLAYFELTRLPTNRRRVGHIPLVSIYKHFPLCYFAVLRLCSCSVFSLWSLNSLGRLFGPDVCSLATLAGVRGDPRSVLPLSDGVARLRVWECVDPSRSVSCFWRIGDRFHLRPGISGASRASLGFVDFESEVSHFVKSGLHWRQ